MPDLVLEGIKLPCSAFGIVNRDVKKRYFNDEVSKEKMFNKKGLVASANLGPDLNTSTFFITLSENCS